MKANPHLYQRKMIDLALRLEYCAWWADMGLGKSLAAQLTVVELFDQFMIEKVLIVAPKLVIDNSWPAEFAKWDDVSHLVTSAIVGSPAAREKAIKADADVYLVTRDNIVWLVDYWLKKKCWPYDMVILDEAHSFKNQATKRFKALKKVQPHIRRMIQLTGTPAPNSLLELWSQMYLLDGGQRLGRTFSGFRNRFFESDYMGYNWTLRPGAEDEIYQLVADVAISLTSEDWLALPDRIEVDAPIVLPPAIQHDYDTLAREMILDIGESDIEAANAAVLVGKLLQMANGAVYDENGDWAEFHQLKLDALQEIREATEGEPLLVAYNYRSDLERLTARFPDAVNIKEPGAKNRWDAGEISMLLAQPKSASMGLNLQEGGRHVVWFGLTWSLQDYLQFNKRLHRQGQNRNVIIHRIVAAGTYDDEMIDVLAGKKSLLDSLLNYTKLEEAA